MESAKCLATSFQTMARTDSPAGRPHFVTFRLVWLGFSRKKLSKMQLELLANCSMQNLNRLPKNFRGVIRRRHFENSKTRISWTACFERTMPLPKRHLIPKPDTELCKVSHVLLSDSLMQQPGADCTGSVGEDNRTGS